MRWWTGIAALVAFAVVECATNPAFWSLVNMETGAEPVTYGQANGEQQHALLGPKAPWPDWAIKPDNSKLVVRAWFGPTATQPSLGYGDLDAVGAAPAALTAYKGKLEANGWSVTASHLRTLSPDLPPQPMTLCFLQADKGVRQIQVSLHTEDGAISYGALHWAEGPTSSRSMARAEPGMC